MKNNNMYNLFNEYNGDVPEIETSDCNIDRIKALTLQKTGKPKIRMKRTKAIAISFIAAALSVGSITAVAYAGGFSYFREILHHSDADKNIPDSLPLIHNDDTSKMENHIAENTILFSGSDNLTISAEGMYYDSNTLMLSLKLISDIELPEDACIIPYFSKEMNETATELKNQSGTGHEAQVVKGDEPNTYYVTYYLTEQNVAGSTIHLSFHNINTYAQTEECWEKLQEFQQMWRDEANADSMTTEEWKNYWKENDFDTRTSNTLKELIKESEPVVEGEWSADIQIPNVVSEPLTVQKNGFKVTADLLSFTLEDYNIKENANGAIVPVILLKDGTCIFDSGTNEQEWFWENTVYSGDKWESVAYRFANINCYQNPHTVDEIENITVYVVNYTDRGMKVNSYEIYQAEE